MAEVPLADDAAGEARFDPVRWRYIEALARRAQPLRGAAKRLVDGKLAAAQADYRRRYVKARSEARRTVDCLCAQYPQAADELQRLLADADFRALERFAAMCAARPTPLAELMRDLAQHSASGGEGGAWSAPVADGGVAKLDELKAIRQFSKTWSELAVDRQLAQAIEQAPDNAGPLNSQRLVLRSLALLREISPDYLRRFMSYADALLWLEQAQTTSKDKAAAKNRAPAKRQ